MIIVIIVVHVEKKKSTGETMCGTYDATVFFSQLRFRRTMKKKGKDDRELRLQKKCMHAKKFLDNE